VLIAGLSVVTLRATANATPQGPADVVFGWDRISGNPALYLSPEKLNWPAVIPPRSFRTAAAGDAGATDLYDVAARTVIRFPNRARRQECAAPSKGTPEFRGLLSDAPQLDVARPLSVLPPDDRQQITPTTDFPWRTICKLKIKMPDGSCLDGTCVIIDDFHVLTAGHCVYDGSRGGWPLQLEIIPGLDGDYLPYNRAWATHIRCPTEWTDSQQTEYDWALVTLDRNIGLWTGYMGRYTTTDLDWYTTVPFDVAGYPADLAEGTGLFWDSDVTRVATGYVHWYYMDTGVAMSGSPVYTEFAGSRYICTIHTRGDDGTGSNHGTRLDQDKYDQIDTWLSEDTPPVDRPELIDDGRAMTSFSPAAVTAGTEFTVTRTVRNIGTAITGGFWVNFYASTNTIIGVYDYLIGQRRIDSLTPFTYADVTWSGPFPDTIPPGTYWVGWVIDPYNELPNEWTKENNQAYDAAHQLTVVPNLAGQVRIAGTTTNVEGATVTVYLGDAVKGTATTNASGIYEIGELPAGTYRVTAAKPGYVGQTKWGVAVVAGATTYVNFFALDRVPAIMGQVRVAGTTTNIAGATVAVLSGDTLETMATTDANGIYRVSAGLAPGTYWVQASKTGYARQTKTNIQVSESATAYVNFNLAVSGKLKGQVKDKASGTPIIGATVVARKDGIVRATATTVAPWGIYEMDSDLPAGTYVVGATMAGYRGQARKDIPVTAGATTYSNYFLQPQ
jgi:glutamyl endopeptidase